MGGVFVCCGGEVYDLFRPLFLAQLFQLKGKNIYQAV
jgi:hypothetical protein